MQVSLKDFAAESTAWTVWHREPYGEGPELTLRECRIGTVGRKYLTAEYSGSWTARFETAPAGKPYLVEEADSRRESMLFPDRESVIAYIAGMQLDYDLKPVIKPEYKAMLMERADKATLEAIRSAAIRKPDPAADGIAAFLGERSAALSVRYGSAVMVFVKPFEDVRALPGELLGIEYKRRVPEKHSKLIFAHKRKDHGYLTGDEDPHIRLFPDLESAVRFELSPPVTDAGKEGEDG